MATYTTYEFTKMIYLTDAFTAYMNTNYSPLFCGFSYTGSTLTIGMADILTSEQLATVTTLVNNYVDPPYFMNFSNTVSLPLHSHYTSDPDLTEIDGLFVLQTFIYQSNQDTNQVLDGLKTIVEYNTPNVQNYINSTSGTVSVQLYDLTRNIIITQSQIDLGTENIATQWNDLAQTGSTIGNTIYKSHQFFGVSNRSTGYDCVWQLRARTSDPYFNIRLNGLQYIYYDYQKNPNV